MLPLVPRGVLPAACIWGVVWSIGCMNTRLACALAVAVLFASCGRNSDPAVSDESANPEAGGVEVGAGGTAMERGGLASGVGPAAGAQLTEVNVDAELERLTQALRKFSFERKRVPKSFAEVTAAGYVSDMPQAPPGKAFSINAASMRVVLVNK
jgi:hypothetical protein